MREKKKNKNANKKGIIFTAVALIFLMVVSFIFFAETRLTMKKRAEVIETRVMTMNDFLKDFHNDADRAIYIAGYRALIAMEEYVSANAQFFNNENEVYDSFKEAFLEGSINGTDMSITENSTFTDYMNKVKIESEKIGMNLVTNITKLVLYQNEPWSVIVSMNISVDAYDEKGLAEWHYNKTFVTIIPILEIKDPLFTVNTLGRFPKTIKRFNLTEFVNDTNNKNDTTNLKLFISGLYYKNSTMAPSFLMRFYNNLSNDTNGIESLIDLTDLGAQIDVDTNRSSVDYIYFSNISNTAKICNVQNMSNWFKIDNEHRDFYEINKLKYTIC